MKTILKLFLIVSISINLFLVKATVLPNTVSADSCQIGSLSGDHKATPGSPISVSAQGNSFRAADWTYIQGFTVDPSKSILELGYITNTSIPLTYILYATIPTEAESGATYIVRILHDTTVNNCGTIVIG